MKNKNTLIYLFSEMLSKALPFFLIPYFTRVLGVDGFGELNLFQVYFNLFVIFISLGGDTLLTRVKFRYGKRIFNELFIFVMLIYLLSYFFMAIIIFFFDDKLLEYALLTSFFISLYNICILRFQVNENARFYLYSQVLFSLLSTILTVFLFRYVGASFEERFIALLFSYIIIILFVIKVDFLNISLGSKWIRRYFKYFKMYISIGFPMFVHKISFFIRNYLDRIIISFLFSGATLGVYSLAAQLVSILPIIFTALNMALYPIVYKKLSSDPSYVFSEIKKITPLLVIGVISVNVIIFFLPSNLFIFIFGEGFVGVNKLFRVLFLAYSLQVFYLMLSNVILYYMKVKVLSICTVISSVIHIVSLYLFSSLGVEYVPYAVLISNFTALLLIFYFGYLPICREVKKC